MLVQEPLTGLWHDPTIRYPVNYRAELISLDEMIRRELGGNCLPEYRRRLVNVMIWHQGNMGIGDGWRPTPSNTSPASQRGESLHQDQRYDDGRSWWSAADMVCRNPIPGGVHVAPPTLDLPVQGSPAAVLYGIHANVGTPGQSGWESWHAQCVEQDGWLTWVNGGRRYPQVGYPFPVLHQAPVPDPKPDDGYDDEMDYLVKLGNDYLLRGASGSRRVNETEFGRVLPNGRTFPRREDAIVIPEGSNEAYWVGQERDAYDRATH